MNKLVGTLLIKASEYQDIMEILIDNNYIVEIQKMYKLKPIINEKMIIKIYMPIEAEDEKGNE